MSATRNPILFEDSWLMVVNKPAGVLSHPNAKTESAPSRRGCAFEGRYHFQERRFDTPDGPIWLIHRLDQDASGVLLAAKTAEIAEKCRVCFETSGDGGFVGGRPGKGGIQKKYLALAAGKPSPPAGVWRDHLVKVVGRGMVRSKMVFGRSPNAELHYEVQSTYRAPLSFSLLDILLVTGRTHQIRIQAARRGHPLAGDPIYGDFQLNRRLRRDMGLRRLFLHATSLAFRHPVDNRPLVLQAPLPWELEDFLDGLS